MTALNEKMILSYSGPFLQENIENMGKSLRIKLQEMDVDFSVLQAVFSVYVELCQNILRYSSEGSVGSMEVWAENGNIVIESRNHVTEIQKEVLESILMRLNRMNKVELRQAYIEQRKKESGKDASCAGLGLIEIAKRASEPLLYTFEKEKDYRMFQLNVRIGGKLRCTI